MERDGGSAIDPRVTTPWNKRLLTSTFQNLFEESSTLNSYQLHLGRDLEYLDFGKFWVS